MRNLRKASAAHPRRPTTSSNSPWQGWQQSEVSENAVDTVREQDEKRARTRVAAEKAKADAKAATAKMEAAEKEAHGVKEREEAAAKAAADAIP